jgi:DNA-binding Lrp family transcriptional regulator
MTAMLAAAPEFRLLNDFQRDFPLEPRPYAALARAAGTTEATVLATLARLTARGAVSRIGATIAPGRIGAATLAALAVPAGRLQAVAAVASEYAGVNHNYEREHRYNLWFVVTAADAARVRRVVQAIEARAGCGRALDLPMRQAFHLDLGFDLGGAQTGAAAAPLATTRYAPSAEEARILRALQDGLALVPRPYAELGARAGADEARVLDVLRDLVAAGLIRRLGVIVSHREAGYCANAMAVWDVPDAAVREAGLALAREPRVALVYERRRARPAWPYNLYCMLHGVDRGGVVRRAAELTARHGLAGPRALLFSRRRFKQCAARYVA